MATLQNPALIGAKLTPREAAVLAAQVADGVVNAWACRWAQEAQKQGGNPQGRDSLSDPEFYGEDDVGLGDPED